MSIINQGSSVVLEDVDDYIAPSQACVNPLFQGSENPKAKEEEEKKDPAPAAPAVVVPNRRRRRAVRRIIPNDNTEVGNSMEILPPSIPQKKKQEDPIKASIADCLACSGCVTTAETVLLEQRHSLSSLRQRLVQNATKRRMITISPNSWADLCRHWKLRTDDSSSTDYRKFAALLHQILQATLVIDGNLPLLWTWLDEADEFVQVYKTKKTMAMKQTTPHPSVAVNSEKTSYYRPNGTSEVILNGNDPNAQIGSSSSSLPLISGSCPALVCLVETSWNSLVPYLSHAQSPMSRVGNTVKQQTQKANDDWDHWAIMPCHDKKLEASRQDFVHNNKAKSHAVDLVITTQELVELVDEWIASSSSSTPTKNEESSSSSPWEALWKTLRPVDHVALSNPNEFVAQTTAMPADQPTLITIASESSLSSPPSDERMEAGNELVSKEKQTAYSSGGHADFIFRHAAKELFQHDASSVTWKAVAGTKKATTIRSARLAKKYAQQQQHYYEAKLFRHETMSGTCSYSQEEETGDETATSTLVLHFVIVHGMQTLQRALKELDDARSSSTSSVVQYVEAMACPYGCVNGGGIVRSQANNGNGGSTSLRETPGETRQRVQRTVAKLSVPSSDALQEQEPQQLYTRYHVVPPMQHTMGAAAGKMVEDMQW